MPIIRHAVAKDIPAILNIERGTNGAHWKEDKYHEAIESEDSRRTVLVAEDELALVGFGVLHLIHSECEIENLVVAANVRLKGVGSQLLSGLIDAARKQAAIRIHLEVREGNLAARELYRKAGFLKTGCRIRYYQEPEEDAILYSL